MTGVTVPLPRLLEPLGVVIVDDEELARVRLNRLLSKESGIEVLADADSGRAAVEAIRRERPDVVFLDVQMPDTDGFGVIAELGDEFTGQVVFVTAFDVHAVRAFAVSAVDYLLKPVAADRLHAAIERARSVIAQQTVAKRYAEVLAVVQKPVGAATTPAPSTAGTSDGGTLDLPDAQTGGPTERFLVKSANRAVLVKAVDVDWFEAEANYVRLHVGTQRHLIRATLSSLDASLDATRFVRIHRTTIVNLDRVKEIQPWFSGDHVVVLTDGTKLRMSRSYAGRLMSRVRAG